MGKDELLDRIAKLKSALDLNSKEKRIKELEEESQNPQFWQDHERAGRLMAELSELVEQIKQIKEVEKEIEQGGDLEKVARLLDKLELATFLSRPYDRENAILSIHAGQGGTEAMDWAAMLERMYLKFSERRGWNTEVVDMTAGEEAGIKSVTMLISGPYAYGYLKNEAGSHRLVRQSPFNAQRLRQTSFALVEVLPQLPETEDVDIKEEDLDWQFFHSSGHGGQNVQKVSTAVRLTHKPTGIVVTAQTERFQEQNRKITRQILTAKLWALKEEKRSAEEKKLKGEYHPASWGTQIRSYVLHPYKQIRDQRTRLESTSPEAVLDGGLDEFIQEEVKIK